MSRSGVSLARILSISLMILVILSSQTILLIFSQQEPLYLIFIWHFHQPWYYGENDSYFILPWVRLHSVGNYFKMAYIVSKYPDIKVTFTFSGSLLDQINAYLSGVRDLRQILSIKVAENQSLSPDEIYQIISIPGGFFDINWGRIVDIVPRYRELRDKTQSVLEKYKYLPDEEMKRMVAASFTDQDIIDLVALFNLFWMDPGVLRDLYPDLYDLRLKALRETSFHFTRDDIKRILSAQIDIMSRLIPIYRDLLTKKQIEIIPVPYSHPMAPVIADFNWSEDLYLHIERSIDLFKKYFNYTPRGVWPAEQAVNDFVTEIFSKYFVWTVSDQAVLGKSGVDANDIRNITIPWILRYGSREIYIFFRNTELSNLISFTYSQWNTNQSVNDLINRLLNIKSAVPPGSVVVIALDGENPWEYYVNFGDDFLNTLYSRLEELQRNNVIKTITPSEYLSLKRDLAREIPLGERSYLDLAGRDIADTPISYTENAYSKLPRKIITARLGEGSWAGGELAIWIGLRKADAAWMLLAKAREDLLKKLNTSSVAEAYKVNPRAVEYLLRAEASDWFWWYGGGVGGFFPANPLYKLYLREIYRSINSSPPDYLLVLFNPDATPIGTLNNAPPKPLEKPPRIDGSVSGDEYKNSLNISIGSLFTHALVAVDPENIYVAIKPADPSVARDANIEISIYLTSPWRSVSPYHLGYNSFPRNSRIDLGIGLFNEIRVFPWNESSVVYIADGKENWLYTYPVQDIRVGDYIELSVSWALLGLGVNDISYLAIAVYKNNSVVEFSTRNSLVYYLQVPRQVIAAGGKTILDMPDPVGDDNGPGTYEYPKADVFKPGVFDLVRFRVIDSGERIVFESYFRDLGGNPWNGPNGFCLQYVHIYIRTTQSNIPGRNDTFGLNVLLADNSSWHIALLLAPGWGSDPVPGGERAALYYYNNSVVTQGDLFKVYADPARNAIIAEVAKSILIDAENIDKWVFTVAVASYDGYGPDRIRPIGVSADTWVVGAGSKYAQAILFNVAPRIMDLLAPTAEDQYRMLNSFVIDRAHNITRPAVVSGVNASMAQASVAIEKTRTETITMITTTTMSTTYTYTQKILETATKIIEKTETAVSEVAREIGLSEQYLVAIVLSSLIGGVVIGVLAMLFIRRTRRG